MKTKSTLFLGLAMLAGLTFYSCEEKDDSTPLSDELYPVKITEYEDGDSWFTTYEYDANKRLVKEDYGDGYYTTYEYDMDGRLIKEENYDEGSLYGYSNLVYNTENKIVKVVNYIYFIDSFEESSYDTLEYNNQGYLIKESHYSGQELRDYSLYEEYDANGNLLTEKYFCGYKDSGINLTDKYDETTYQYDDKNNIYKNCEFVYYIFVESGKNNVTQHYIYEHYGENNTETYTYTYVYNEDNYPVEYILKEEGVETYKCKIEYKEL